jgi:hypothetical protein
MLAAYWAKKVSRLVSPDRNVDLSSSRWSDLTGGSTEKRSQGGGRFFGLVLELLRELCGRPSG